MGFSRQEYWSGVPLPPPVKPEKDTAKKKKKIRRPLKANIYEGHTYKNHQQNISKPNLTIYKKDHTSLSSGIVPGMKGQFNIHK